jgi:type II secretion system protein N
MMATWLEWLRARRKALIRYGSFFALCSLVSAYLTFPRDVLREYIIQSVEHPLTKEGTRRVSGLHMRIQELETSWLTGVTLTGVEFYKEKPSNPNAATVLAADEVTLRVSLWSLLWGNQGGSLHAEVGNGTVDVSVSMNDERLSLEASLDAVPLRQLLPKGLGAIPLFGEANGEIELDIDTDPKQTEGAIELTIAQLVFGDGKQEIPIPGAGMGFAVDKTNAGTLNIVIPVSEGVAKVKTFRAKGPDIEMQVQGTIHLLRALSMSRIEGLMRLKFSESYRGKHEWLNGLYSIMDLNPTLRAAKTTDDALQYKLSGSLGGSLFSTPAGSMPPPS